MIEWRDVVGFEGEYEVSSDGQIRSKDRVRKYYRNGKRAHDVNSWEDANSV